MDINITGRHLDIGKALKAHITERVEMAAEKYFSRTVDVLVTITKENHLFSADCNFHVGGGTSLHSHNKNSDVYAAFDQAADKVEKQLRKYKERIKKHHGSQRKEAYPAIPAQAYVLARKGKTAKAKDDTEAAPHTDPIIIAESKTEFPHVSVGDAVSLMDLADAQVLMFRNINNGQLGVVYHRPDGHIGWIESAAD